MYDLHNHLLRTVAGSRGKEGKLPYVLTRCRVSQFVVPLRGRMQTLSRVRNPSDVTPSTGDAQPIFIPCCGLEKAMWNSIESDPARSVISPVLHRAGSPPIQH